MRRNTASSSGPFRTDQVGPKDRYEIHNGHAVYCAPTGGEGARGAVVGALVLASDPMVKEAGFDAGYTTGGKELHAPDISIGRVPDEPGWIHGSPPLTVEYVGSGQDKGELQDKIHHLLEHGTMHVWVVRLRGCSGTCPTG